jgi:hypothetical protein
MPPAAGTAPSAGGLNGGVVGRPAGAEVRAGAGAGVGVGTGVGVG